MGGLAAYQAHCSQHPYYNVQVATAKREHMRALCTAPLTLLAEAITVHSPILIWSIFKLLPLLVMVVCTVSISISARPWFTTVSCLFRLVSCNRMPEPTRLVTVGPHILAHALLVVQVAFCVEAIVKSRCWQPMYSWWQRLRRNES